MENHTESESFSWFDELPVGARIVPKRESSPSVFSIRDSIPGNAIVVVPPPAPRERGVPIWVLAFAAIAGASTFVLGATLISLL